MLSKLAIGGGVLIGLLLLMGTLFRPGFWQELKPKGNTPFQKIGSSSCPDPLVLRTPVDLDKVTSVLYPGQMRGGNFKAHGGFRFDNAKDNAIEVKTPIDAYITDGARYIEQGEVQYMFDFQSDCGIRFRFDHLLTLAPKLTELVSDLPQARENDSRTTHINKNVKITEGEIVATAVGFRKTNNVSVDFGVYDMRGKLLSSPQDNAVCWFDWLSQEDAKRVRSLPPGDSTSGSKSTLCKP